MDTFCKVRYTVQLVPETYQIIELNILCNDGIPNALVVGREVIFERYGYHEDLIVKQELLCIEDLYGRH